MALTPINTYTVAHGKKGTGGGGGSYYNGGARLSGIANVKSINAATGNISNLNVNNLRANNANIIYLTSQEGNIFKLSGEECHYNYGYFNNIAMDRLSAKKLKVDDLEAINAVIETLNSKNITTEYLTVTKQAHFFELVIDKIRAAGGQIILSPASCIFDYVYAMNEDGEVITESSHTNYKSEAITNLNSIRYFDVYWRSTDNEGRGVSNDFVANDLAICQSFNNAREGVSHDVANKYYWRQVTNIIDDIYINLSTGAKSLNANESDYNRFEVKMYRSLQKMNDEFIDNNVIWDCQAQTIEGIQTGVTWNGQLTQDNTINGEFCTNSQIYGIQFTPIRIEGVTTQITNKIQFNIKKYYDNLGTRMYVKPNKMNVGVYFDDDSFIFFNDIQVNPISYDVEFDLGNPNTAISAITIVCTEEINWHKCHGIRISNKYIPTSEQQPTVPADNSECDYMVVPEASVPEVGDNLVQLGSKTDTTRQSAIIIAAYMTPDAGLTAPSYAQYMGINDFHLAAHRQSYIDANGAKFIGDITLCSVNGKSISEALETSNKKIITSTDIVQVYQTNGTNPVITIIPDNIAISVLMPEEGDTSSTVVTYTVPHGYVVQLTYYNNNNQPISAQSLVGYDTIFYEDDNMSSINLYKSDTITGVHMVRIKLLKEVNGEQIADYPVVDMKDINYIMGAEDGENGGHYEFRYKNAVAQPTKPLEGFDGTTDGWSAHATTPDFTIGEFTWMTQCFVDEDDVYGEWTDPIRITGDNGKDGEDGALVEFIYAHNDTGVAPDAPVKDASNNPVNTQDDWHGADSHGIIWYDNPQGVGPNSKYEYVSSRQRAASETTWSSFSTPVVWSKWGEKGMDGDGYEYIYALTAEKVAPSNPTPQDISTSTYQTDDYIPTGWTDDPQQISQTYPFQWVCVRKRINGIWGAFDGPVLWARYAEVGETGGHYEFRYKNYTPTVQNPLPATPTGTGTTGGWSDTPTDPDIENGEYTYMSQSFVTPDSGGDIYGTWTTPIRITGGKGDTGADGNSVEFIYKVQNSATPPATPATAQQDDYVPTGWTDNPTGVSESNMYEFVCTRTKNNDVWSNFSTPVVWSKWGEKGMDGDGFEYIYKLSAEQNTLTGPTMPSNWQSPTSDYQTHDEYVTYLSGEGWHDDPLTVSVATNERICWVSVRKKNNGVWGRFSTPAKWSNYVLADQTIPGADGKDAELNYLIPVKETLVAKMINAISNQTNCDLQCELQYNLVHLKGDTTNTLTWSSQTWYLRISAYNSSFNRINNAYYYATSNGTSSGTPQGTYSKSNFMTVISYADSDYMKCYQNKSSYCPIYLLVELMNGNTVMDTRTVPVQVETGAVLKVTNDAITSAVASSKTYTEGVLVNYSTIQQTDSKISTAVTQSLTNYYTKDQVYNKSQIDQTANSITSTVSSQTSSINTLNSDMRTVQSDVSTLQQTATNLTSTINSQTTSIKTLNGSVNTLTNSVSTLQQTSDDISSTVTSHTTSIKSLNDDVGNIKRDYVTSSQITQLSNQISMSVKDDYSHAGLTITSGKISIDAREVIIEGEQDFNVVTVGRSSGNNVELNSKALIIRSSSSEIAHYGRDISILGNNRSGRFQVYFSTLGSLSNVLWLYSDRWPIIDGSRWTGVKSGLVCVGTDGVLRLR